VRYYQGTTTNVLVRLFRQSGQYCYQSVAKRNSLTVKDKKISRSSQGRLNLFTAGSKCPEANRQPPSPFWVFETGAVSTAP